MDLCSMQPFRDSYYVRALFQNPVQDFLAIILPTDGREGAHKEGMFLHNFWYLKQRITSTHYPLARPARMVSLTREGSDYIVNLHFTGRGNGFGRHLASSATFSRLCFCLTFSFSLPSSPSFTKETYHGKVIISIFFSMTSTLSSHVGNRLSFRFNKHHSESDTWQAWNYHLHEVI